MIQSNLVLTFGVVKDNCVLRGREEGDNVGGGVVLKLQRKLYGVMKRNGSNKLSQEGAEQIIFYQCFTLLHWIQLGM